MSASRSRRGTAPAPAPKGFDVDAFLRTFDQFDARLVAAGFPATSPWWRAQIEAFLRSGEARWILRVGRRGGKSTTLSRLGVVWALAGPWSIARGDTPTVAILSVDREEASRRLDTIEAVLGALGVGCTRAGETLALDARGVVFRVETRSKNAVGFTSIMVLADECSRWESREDKADPASEVIASIAPTLAGMRHCFMVLASSPWSEVDYHAKAFDDARDAGPGAGKGFASAAPTWIARPDFTEEHTRTLEPDPRAWSREYAAIPGSTISGAFDAADVNRAFERGSDGAIALANEEVTALETVIAIDASSMRPGSDTFAIAVIRLLESGYHVDSVHAVPEGATFTAAIQHVVDIAREHGARRVILDQHQDAGLDAAFTALGLGVDRIVLGAKSKPQAIATLRRLLRDDRITLPAEASPWLTDVPAGRDRLRIELLTLKAKLLADGTERVPSNGIDFASTLITFAAAIDAGFVAGDAIELPDFSGPAALQAMALPGLSTLADPSVAMIFTPDERADEREAAAARDGAARLTRARQQGRAFWDRYQAASEARAEKASRRAPARGLVVYANLTSLARSWYDFCMHRGNPSRSAGPRRGRPPVASPLVAAVTRLRAADRARIDHIASAFGWTGGEAMRECIRRGAAELLTGHAPPGESLLVLTPEGHTELRVTLGAEQAELSANLEALISNHATERARRAGARLTERRQSRADVIPIDFEAIESNA